MIVMPFGTSLGSQSSIVAVTIQMIPGMIVMPFGTSLGPLVLLLQVSKVHNLVPIQPVLYQVCVFRSGQNGGKML